MCLFKRKRGKKKEHKFLAFACLFTPVLFLFLLLIPLMRFFTRVCLDNDTNTPHASTRYEMSLHSSPVESFFVPFSFSEQQQPFLSQMLYSTEIVGATLAVVCVHYDDDAETEERVLPH